MISVVLYGRNDSHGYNLHKRGALSLNCIAEVLDDPDDEILFVDWNTPDDFPTFPEAIADTLTDKARRVLRILRVRPAQHARFAARTHLVALEPPARNVAVRRSNPANRWVLSTNTDMIFVPRTGRSLSVLAAGLPDGYYHLPRFELPETLWEGLDRRDPPATIAAIADWAQRFHLNEIVTLAEPAIRFDGPGDFQLALRTDLHAMHGFDERMLLGWHVDSNIAVRLAMRHGGAPGDLVADLAGYHCDHTRQVTPAHRVGAVQNDWRRFVEDVACPRAPDQSDWGLGEDIVEEVRLTGRNLYVAALEAAIPAPSPSPRVVAYAGEPGRRTDYDPEHVLPFLVDAVCSMPRDLTLAWVATAPDLLARFAVAWRALGFRRPIQSVQPAPDGSFPPATADALAEAQVLVFDFALTDAMRAVPGKTMLDIPALCALADLFEQVALAERQAPAAGPPRRYITVNTVANDLEPLVASHVGATAAPYSTRLRQGLPRPWVPPAIQPQWPPDIAAAIRATAPPQAVPPPQPAVPPLPARLATALARRLSPEWQADLRLWVKAIGDSARAPSLEGWASRALARHAPRLHRWLADHHAHYHATRIVDWEPLPPLPPTRGIDILPLLTLGEAGIRHGDRLLLAGPTEGFVAFGPFLPLSPGIYRAHLSVDLRSAGSVRQRRHSRAIADVVSGARWFAVATLVADGAPDLAIDFTIAREDTPARVELRLRKPAGMSGAIRAATLECLWHPPD